MRWPVIRWFVAMVVVMLMLSASVVLADSSWTVGEQQQQQQRSSREMLMLPSGRFLLPIEISVPDLINGVLATFRYFWVRFQWLFGLSDTTIVGAKDPPAHALATASAALKAVPLAPEPVGCSPISTVSVEVDDPVRHPYLHKTKVIRRKKRKKRRKKRLEKANTIDWDMVALEAWSLL